MVEIVGESEGANRQGKWRKLCMQTKPRELKSEKVKQSIIQPEGRFKKNNSIVWCKYTCSRFYKKYLARDQLGRNTGLS